ncbi:protein DEK, putative, partial [Entamoeba invadens IP1]
RWEELSEIEEIKATMKSIHKGSEKAILIHKVLYGSIGSEATRRTDIMDFSGIKGENATETKELVEKKEASLAKLSYADLIEVCRVLCLAGASKEKTKEKYAQEIVKFMQKPGNTKPVVTATEDVAHVEESEEEEEKKPKKTAKKGKKEEKEEKPKKSAKKETKSKKEEKEEKPKKTTKKETKKEAKTPKKDEKKPAKKEEKEAKTPKKETKKEKKETKTPKKSKK